MLIKGDIEYEMGDYVTAEETMSAAVALPNVRKRVADVNSLNFKVLTFS